MARVVFLGTPRSAVPTLELLSQKHDVRLVVTQPDRPKGRSKKPVPPPVKDWAINHELDVRQPANRQELATAITEGGPFDVGVVVAYGRILRPEALDAPGHGLVNVHFSLLPRWRGAAPVARALMAGDTMTGVTIIKLDEGLDTGDVLTAQAIDIADTENAGELTERLAELGARLLVAALPRYMNGELKPVAQSEEGLTYADKIERADRPIDIDSGAAAVVAQIRGLAPTPGATLDIDGKTHKIYEVSVVDTPVEGGTWATVDGRPLVGLADGTVEILSLQPAGKTRQSGSDWVNGQQSDSGVVS